MSLNLEVSCPCCKKKLVSLIGRLPSYNWFAGQQTKEPFPGGDLYRCANCYMKFRYPILPEEKYLKLYDNSLTTIWTLESSRPDWKIIANYIHSSFSEGGKVLDFGCYNGGFLTTLHNCFDKFGIEVNKSSAEIAEKRNNARVWQSIENIPDELNFNIITVIDVIEHVSNPADIIDKLMKKLSKNGIIIITTGDAENYIWNIFGANWWYCFFIEHISFISEKWLNYFSKEYQKEIVYIKKFKYLQLSIFRFSYYWITTILYGLFPNLYLKAGQLINKIRGTNADFLPKSIGISSDHIFVVLRSGR